MDLWKKIHDDIDYIRDYWAELTTPKNMKIEEYVSIKEKFIYDLKILNMTTKHIFPEYIYDLEKEIILSLTNFIPSSGSLEGKHELPKEKYSKM